MSEEQDKSLSQAKAYAYRLVSRKSYTKKEISEKLKNKGFISPVRVEVLDELAGYNYLNDLEFARLWIKSRMHLKPKGERALRLELLKKGIKKELINQALDEVLKDYNQEELVLSLARRRIEKLNLDLSLKTRRRIFSYLARRGFSSSIILKSLGQIFKNDYHQ